jgi:polyhydroxybutyrate depolymerase
MLGEKPNRMGSTLLVLVLVMIVGASLACGRTTGKSQTDSILIESVLDHSNLKREYVLVTPVDLEPDKSYPLVLTLHGGGGNGERMCALKRGIQELAGQEDFFVVCPSGIEKHWNDGREIDQWRAHAEDIDDVGFLLHLVTDLIERYPVDASQIFVTGVSNGGKMSLRLACEADELFRAAAAVIASLPADLVCEPSGPISILIMNGTDDPLVPWDGGQVTAFNRELGKAVSTPDTVAFWVRHNECESDPIREDVADLVKSDKSSIQVERYNQCNRGTNVVLYTVFGGGHTWPGGPQYLPEFLIGRTNRDMHAGEAIWEFFEASAR